MFVLMPSPSPCKISSRLNVIVIMIGIVVGIMNVIGIMILVGIMIMIGIMIVIIVMIVVVVMLLGENKLSECKCVKS
jgi:hypothetical protein